MAQPTNRRRTKTTTPGRIRTCIVIDADSYRRLGSAAVAEDRDQSEIVQLLIDQHLSGYVTQVRGPRLTWEKDRRTATDPINPPALEVA